MANLRPIVDRASTEEIPDSDTLDSGDGLVLVQQSVSAATPSANFAVLYCKTDKQLYYKTSSGVERLLT